MITETEARRIASDWHSGQSSALYAFSSSGSLDYAGAEAEIRRASEPWTEGPKDVIAELESLREYVGVFVQAYDLGRDAAENAASWTTDGNESDESRIRKLTMLEEGDPAADDYLPAPPDLSGEWADGWTPASLRHNVTGGDVGDLDSEGLVELEDALADAWEAGRDDTFGPAVEAELRSAVGAEIENAAKADAALEHVEHWHDLDAETRESFRLNAARRIAAG